MDVWNCGMLFLSATFCNHSSLGLPALLEKEWLEILPLDLKRKHANNLWSLVVQIIGKNKYKLGIRYFSCSSFLRLNVGTGLNIFRASQKLALHVWHKVSITRNDRGVRFIVNDEVIHMTSNPRSLGVRLRGSVTFGAVNDAMDR